MLTYQTELPYSPPGFNKPSAVAGILDAKPHHLGQRGQDVYDMMAYKNASDYDRASQKGDNDYQLRQQEYQRQLVLKGLGDMAEEQQRQNELANRSQSLVYGTAGNLLGGLFR